MEKNNNDLFELMTKMYADLKGGQDELNKRLGNVEANVNSVKAATSKNSILLEKLDSNIKLLAEDQESFRNQIGRNKRYHC